MRIETQANGRVELRFYDGLGVYVPIAVESLRSVDDPTLVTSLREMETAAEAYDNEVGVAKRNTRFSPAERREMTQTHRKFLTDAISTAFHKAKDLRERANAECTRALHAPGTGDNVAKLNAIVQMADRVIDIAAAYRNNVLTKTEARFG